MALDVPRQRALGGVGPAAQGTREGRAIVTLHVLVQSPLAFVRQPTAFAREVALLLVRQHVRAQAVGFVGLVVANRAQQVHHLARQENSDRGQALGFDAILGQLTELILSETVMRLHTGQHISYLLSSPI